MSFWWEITSLVQLDPWSECNIVPNLWTWMMTRTRTWLWLWKESPIPWFLCNNSSNSHKMKALLHHQKWSNIEAKQENGKCIQDKSPKNHENNCYRWGIKRHWLHTYRTPKHLVDLYQASIKAKWNFTDGDGLNLTYYDIDFFGGPSEKINHLINDENTNIDWCYFIYQIIYCYVLYLYLVITFFFYILLFILCPFFNISYI